MYILALLPVVGALTEEQAERGFVRCLTECGPFYPSPKEIIEKFGAAPKQAEDAEARAAFDAAIEFTDRHIGCIDGQYEPVYKWRGQSPPKLSPRLLSSVRHSGGWSAFKNRTDKSFPFLQKLFLENYQSCEAIEHKRTSLLPEKSDHECLADVAEAYKQLPEPKHSDPGLPSLFSKRMPKPAPTEAELAARLELLRKQEAELAAKQNGGTDSAA